MLIVHRVKHTKQLMITPNLHRQLFPEIFTSEKELNSQLLQSKEFIAQLMRIEKFKVNDSENYMSLHMIAERVVQLDAKSDLMNLKYSSKSIL